MKKIIFQLLSCLYLYDSSIPVPVCVRKQSRFTGIWPVALIYRVAGIPEFGGGVDIPCRRYTGVWRRRVVCAKPVYRRLASKGLNTYEKKTDWILQIYVNLAVTKYFVKSLYIDRMFRYLLYCSHSSTDRAAILITNKVNISDWYVDDKRFPISYVSEPQRHILHYITIISEIV